MNCLGPFGFTWPNIADVIVPDSCLLRVMLAVSRLGRLFEFFSKWKTLARFLDAGAQESYSSRKKQTKNPRIKGP